ncbi:MAG: HlyD family efflux transporter periplasmic adaptor subunit [Spirochaetales bacterium]|nr:HlyD family efflux transporter periplasmic adaptor subunit [Spirochaetales bacterium]
MAKKKRLLFIGAIILIVLIVAFSIFARTREKLPEVDALRVTLEDFRREVSANGEIGSKNRVSLYSTVSAEITSVPLQRGDRVEAGDVIAFLDKESLESSLISAENALENARMTVRSELLSLRTSYTSALTNRDQVQREYLRYEELHKIGSASDEELKRRHEALVLAEDTLESARQRLNFREGRPLDDPRTSTYLSDERIVETSPEVKRALIDRDNILRNLAEYRITANIGGVITELPVEGGSIVTPGTLVARIEDSSALEVRANIDEVDLSYIALGQEVKITSDSFIGRELKGKVSEIGPVIRKVGDSRICDIKVDISENPDGIARIGAGVSIFILVEEKIQVPAIPVEAYFFEEGKKWVHLLTPSPGEDPENPERCMVEKREVETGILGIETLEVTRGLAEDELIIAHYNPVITPEMEVLPILPQEEETP